MPLLAQTLRGGTLNSTNVCLVNWIAFVAFDRAAIVFD